MTLSTTDQDRLRNPKHSIRPHLDIWRRSSVATALINQVGFVYPLGELLVDNTSAGWVSDVEVGQQLAIGTSAGDDDVTTGVVRLATDSTTLYLDGKSLGDPGKANNANLAIDENQFVTIYNFFPLWTLLSRIVNGVFYKQFDVAYTDEGSNPAPVLNFGAWRWAFLDGGATTAQFVFDAGTDSFAWGAKTISSYLWSIPAGWTIDSGTATTSSITASGPAGFHIMKCKITDSGGAPQTGYRPVWIWDRLGTASTAPLSNKFRWMITSDTQTLKGREMTIEIYSDASNPLDTSEIFKGAAFIVAEEALYGGASLTSGVGVDTFVGFVDSYQHIGTLNKNTTILNLKSPMLYFDKLPMVSQAVLEKASPSNWTEVSTSLADPNFLVWYVLQHHAPNALRLFDYFKLGEASPPKKRLWSLNGQSVAQQLGEIEGFVKGNIGSASDGTLFFTRLPNYQGATYRNTTMENPRMTIDERDIVKQVEFPYQYRAQTGSLLTYAFAFDGTDVTAVASLAPGAAQGQGTGRQQEDTLVVTDQTEANAITGHAWAELNANIPEVEIDLERNFDIFDCARYVDAWWTLDVPARFTPDDVAFNKRAIVTQVGRSWSETKNKSFIKALSSTFRFETSGKAGVTIDLQTGQATDQTWGAQYTSAQNSQNLIADFLFVNMGIGASTSQIYRILNPYTNPSATWAASSAWSSYSDAASGDLVAIAIDWYSALPASGWTSGTLGAWGLLRVSTSQIKVYYTSDVLDSTVNWTIQRTIATTSLSAVGLTSDPGTEDLVIVAFRTGTTYSLQHSEDGGSTWSTTVTVLASSGSPADHQYHISIVIDGSNVVQPCKTSGGDTRLYWAPTSTYSFAQVSSHPSDTPEATALRADNGTLYFGAPRTLTSTLYSFIASPCDGGAGWSAGTCTTCVAGSGWAWNAASCGSFGDEISTISGNLTQYLKGIEVIIQTRLSWTGDYTIKVDAPTGGTTYTDAGTSTGDNTYAHNILINENLSAQGIEVFMNAPGELSSSEQRLRSAELFHYTTSNRDAVYKVTSYTGSPTWTDIKESEGYSPYGGADSLVVEGTGILSFIGDTGGFNNTNDGAVRIVRSANGGSSYGTAVTYDYDDGNKHIHSLIRNNLDMVINTNDEILWSEDGGSNFTSLGNPITNSSAICYRMWGVLL